jgi:hypothetical protein
MDFLKLLTIGRRKGRVRTLAELITAIAEGAAFLAQGASYSYIRARSGTLGPRLMQDAVFNVGMEYCKWEAFAAVAGDLILIVEAELRSYGSWPATFWRRLYREVLATHDVPEHRAESGWDDRIAEFDRRLEAHLAGPARGIEEICEHSAGVLMDNVPVTDDIRELDREMVVNNVKFRFIEHISGLRQRADWPALATSVTMAADESS